MGLKSVAIAGVEPSEDISTKPLAGGKVLERLEVIRMSGFPQATQATAAKVATANDTTLILMVDSIA